MQSTFTKLLPQYLLVMIILLLGSVYLFHDSMGLDPAFVHSWTQSDRLAIAMNFQENGFDFFHPATYNLLTKDGITQVDFPIHDYLIAIISSLTRLDLPFTFRLYNLAFFLTGLFYFFKACRQNNVNSLLAIVATIFIATLPFLAYYQNGFLPSVPSYGLFCIGLYFLIRSRQSENGPAFYWSVCFISLAALARIPFSIFLIALMISLGYQAITKKKLEIKKVLAPLVGLLLVIGYFLYNRHLANTYGSMFLSTFRTAEDGSGLWQSFLEAAERWQGQIFSPYHWLTLIALALLYFKGSKRLIKANQNSFLWIFSGVSAIGVLIYYVLMSLQFVDHDYYLIDSFLPLLTLSAIPFLSLFKIQEKWYASYTAFALILCLSLYAYARSNQNYRYQSGEKSRIHYHYQVFERAADQLDAWGVEKEDTLAVFDISSTNLPFTSWQRKGFSSLSSGERQAKVLLAKPFDYALLIDSFKVSDSYFDYPDLAKQLEYVAGNGEISIYRKQPSNEIDQFFKTLYAHSSQNFDDSEASESIPFNRNAELVILDDDKGRSLKITENSEFPLTAEYHPLVNIENKVNVSLQFEYFPVDSAKGVQLVLTAGDFYYAFYLENEIEEDQYWQTLQFHRRIPSKYLNGHAPLKVYFWNPLSSMAYIDNYEILIYE